MTVPATSPLERIDRTLAAVYEAGVVPGADGTEHAVYPSATDAAQGHGIRELVAAERAQTSFEIGFAMGLSTLHICAGLLEGGASTPRHVAVDPTEHDRWGDAGLRLVREAGLDGVVEHVPEESQVALPRWMSEGRQFDLAFIDGDHRFDPCFLDIYYALRLVRMGGLIVVDDMWMPSVRTAVAFFHANLDLELLPDALPGGFRWTRRPPWRKVRSGHGQTAVLRKPREHVERGAEHFIPFW